MRTLIYIPIIHTQTDMGALQKSVRQIKIEKLGKEGWEHTIRTIDRLWEEIFQGIEELNLPYPQVRLYQDGLPVCGHEKEIVEDLAAAGSRNHQLLLELVAKGATLMATESPALLLEEYGLIQQVLAGDHLAATARTREQQKALSCQLLAKRDQFIAERINKTLNPAETGLLFLGILHSLEDRLAPDIRVSYPILSPARQPRGG